MNTIEKVHVGLDAIYHFLENNISIIGVYPSGAFITKGDDIQKAYTNSKNVILNLWNGKGDSRGRALNKRIELFRFLPGNYGLICIDIDRGHKDKVDGLSNFYRFFQMEGKVLPRIFDNIEQGTFPCYVTTPSGGYHLYFRYKGNNRYNKQKLTTGVEVFQYEQPLTVPGSRKENGEYVLYGNLDDVPILPKIIEDFLKPAVIESRLCERVYVLKMSTHVEGKTDDIPLIAHYVKKNICQEDVKPYSLAYEIARHCAPPYFEYTKADVLRYLRIQFTSKDINDTELSELVLSAFMEAYYEN